MSPKIAIVTAAFAAGLAGAAANAAGWGEKVEMCAEAAEAEGFVDLDRYAPRFESGASRRITVEFEPVDGGEPIYAECKIARGRVVAIDIDA